MSPEDDSKLNSIYLVVGEIKQASKSLTGDVKEIRRGVDELNKTSVARTECSEKHRIITDSMNNLVSDLGEIKKDVKYIKRGSGQAFPAVGYQPSADTQERLEEENARVPRDVRYWLGITAGVIMILTFLGGLGFSIMKTGRYIERVDAATATTKKQQQELQKKLKQILKATKNSVTVSPDNQKRP